MEPGSIILRALSGLAEGSGRVVVIVGPPGSGKSQTLNNLKGHLEQQGCRTIEVSGSYRDRSVSQVVAARIVGEHARLRDESDGSSESGPTWGLPAGIPSTTVPSRQRLQHGGRRSLEVRPEEFWRDFVTECAGSHPRALAVLVDDAALSDPESREFLVFLAARARLRPFILALVLDESLPAFGLWDAAFTKRPEVDWIRLPRSHPDPRDVLRLQSALRSVPPRSLGLARYMALMGGSASQIELGRVARITHSQVVDALQPLTASGAVKNRGDRVSLGTEGASDAIVESIPEVDRRRMHGEVAEAIVALHPEPSLEERVQIALHRYASAKDVATLASLRDAARLEERLQQYDAAVGHLGEAIECASSLDSNDRLGTETEVRFDRSRDLAFAGRPEEAGRELREAFGLALQAAVPPERLEEFLLGLLPTLRLLGPRPTLVAEVAELAERLEKNEAFGPEVLAIAALTEFDLQRDLVDAARIEAARISRIARVLPSGPLQAIALCTVAAALGEGSEAERAVAEKCLRSARLLLARHRETTVHLYAEEVYARALTARGERASAMNVYEQAAQVAQHAHLPALELLHEVGFASLLIDERPDPRLGRSLVRARQLVEELHLVPPSVPLLALQLLEGRFAARADRLDTARELWSATAHVTSSSVPTSFRAEAWLRLADLELSQQRPDEAQVHLGHLENPETLRGLRLEWASWFAELRGRADRVDPAAPPPALEAG